MRIYKQSKENGGSRVHPEQPIPIVTGNGDIWANINDLWSIVMTRRDEKAVSGGMLRARMEGVATVASGPAKKYSEPNRVEHHYSMKPLSRHINGDWHSR